MVAVLQPFRSEPPTSTSPTFHDDRFLSHHVVHGVHDAAGAAAGLVAAGERLPVYQEGGVVVDHDDRSAQQFGGGLTITLALRF